MNRHFRLPLLPVFAAYAFGLYAGYFDLPLSAQTFMLIIAVLLAGWVFLFVTKRRAAASWVLLSLFFALAAFSIRMTLHPPASSRSLSNFIGLDRIAVEGIVDRSPQRSPGGTNLLVRSERVILSDRQFPVEGRVLLILKEEHVPLRLGDRIRFLCKLLPPRGFQNPGGFDYERHLAFDRIYTVGFLSVRRGWVKLGEGFSNPVLIEIENWRDRIRHFLTMEASSPASGIFKALVLGEQGDIPEEVRESFVRIGIAHLLAISGDHLGIVALLSYSLFLWLLKRSETLLLSTSVRKWAAALTVPCLLFYTFIAGGGISVIRAAIMVILFFLSILFQRERHLLHTLAVAAFVILIFSPPSLFHVSFQLSFIAVLSILVLMPPLLREIKKEESLVPRETPRKGKALRYIKISLLVTAAASLGTGPFVALHFNRISPVGLITNLFFIPWVGFVIVPLTLSASLMSFLFPPLATALICVDEFITLALLKVVGFFDSFPFASLYVSTPTVFEILLFSALLLTAVHFRKGRRVRYLFVGLALLLTFDVVYWNVKGSLQKTLAVTFLDVGHGDSILVEFPGGRRMLIDGGGLHEDRLDTGKNVIAPFLWKKKIREIDTLVLTHPDPDHLKGLRFIASQFSIGRFWDNGFQTGSEPYLELKKTLLEKGIEWQSCNETTPPRMIGGVEISFLNPPATIFLPRNPMNPSFLNNGSLVIRLQLKNVVFLLAADIEKEAEERIAGMEEALRADILKVPHHGSASSSTPYFLQRVKPAHAILSVGEQTMGRLPHPDILKRYEELGTKIFRTDRQGAVTVTTDGEKIAVETHLR